MHDAGNNDEWFFFMNNVAEEPRPEIEEFKFLGKGTAGKSTAREILFKRPQIRITPIGEAYECRERACSYRPSFARMRESKGKTEPRIEATLDRNLTKGGPPTLEQFSPSAGFLAPGLIRLPALSPLSL